MAILAIKLNLLLSLIQLKIAQITDNRKSQQHKVEQIISLHIRLQVAREQQYNKHLFSSI